MKNFLLLLISIPLFSYTINFKKSFEIELKPDILKAFININVVKNSEKEILQTLSKYSSYFEENDYLTIKGGNYSINPQYKYENNRRYKSGYQGFISYEVSSSKPKYLNTFLLSLHNKNKDLSVDLAISQVSWILSKEQKNHKFDQLRFKAIKWADKYTNTLSTNLNTSCKVVKISLDHADIEQPHIPMLESKAIRNSYSPPTPSQDLQKILIRSYYELECK